MADIQFGRESRSFRKFTDIFHVVACLICLVLAAAAVLIPSYAMRIFPFIFLDGAALALLLAYMRLRSVAGRHQGTFSGLVLGFVGVLLLGLAYIGAVSVW